METDRLYCTAAPTWLISALEEGEAEPPEKEEEPETEGASLDIPLGFV